MMSRPWLHGFLDLCLLAMLRERADYGYGLHDFNKNAKR